MTGLVLSDISSRNKIPVSGHDFSRALEFGHFGVKYKSNA